MNLPASRPQVAAILHAVVTIDRLTIEYCETRDIACLSQAKAASDELSRLLQREITNPTFQPTGFAHG